MKKLSPQQVRMLRSVTLQNRKSPLSWDTICDTLKISGRSQYGGAACTFYSLKRLGFVTDTNGIELTEAGRTALLKLDSKIK